MCRPERGTGCIHAVFALEFGQIWVDLARKHQCEEADAYFISCTAVRSAEVIEEIEALVGRPVITSNQAMVWYALRKNAIANNQPGFGSLFSITTI